MSTRNINLSLLLVLFSLLIVIAVAQNGSVGRREKRGAAVYRTFPNRPSGGHRSFSESNPQAFVSYLGGSGGGGSGGGSYGGGGGSSSSAPGLGLNYGGSSNLASRYAQSGYGSSG